MESFGLERCWFPSAVTWSFHATLLLELVLACWGSEAPKQGAVQRVTKLQGLILVYASAPPNSLLWPYSAATLRKRFCSLLEGVSLETKRVGGRQPFDLGSLRPGGATHLFGGDRRLRACPTLRQVGDDKCELLPSKGALYSIPPLRRSWTMRYASRSCSWLEISLDCSLMHLASLTLQSPTGLVDGWRFASFWAKYGLLAMEPLECSEKKWRATCLCASLQVKLQSSGSPYPDCTEPALIMFLVWAEDTGQNSPCWLKMCQLLGKICCWRWIPLNAGKKKWRAACLYIYRCM